jgi:hypothetical protein
MNCWHCDRPAHGCCQFCGRGVCKEHVQSLPHIIGIFHDGKGKHKAIVVGDALFCGVCRPREDPVELPDLD